MSYVCYLNPRKSNNQQMIGTFVEGAAVAGLPTRIVTVSGILRSIPMPRQGEIAVFYGVDDQTLALWHSVQRAGLPFAYIDNGYFESKWKGGSYYRITSNAMQHVGNSPSDGARWGRLGISMKPMRAHDGYLLIALQSDWWYLRHGTSKEAWLGDVLAKIKPYLGKYKPMARDKSEHKTPINWDDVRAVITHSSNVAVDGIVEGVPCFTTNQCAATRMAGAFPMVDLLHCPHEREVLPWCWSLADNQWTVDEIKAGKPFEVL